MGRKTRLLAVILLAVLAIFAAGCGKDKDEKTKDKVKDANEKAAELEKEDEKSQAFEFRTGSEGAILTKYSGEDEDVEIPAEYEGQPVVEIASNVFKGCENMRSLTIPPSIKKLGNTILDEATGIVIRGYDNTAAQFLAYTISGLQFESMGVNKQKAQSVKIWDAEGAHYTTLCIGESSDEDSVEGVSFEEKSGESVLRLENANIGSLEVDEYASLVVELAEGSVNHIEGQRGRKGINSNGAVTITGAGSLYVTGSDYYSMQEAGYGMYVLGNLTIEKEANVSVKAGAGKSTVNIGVYVFGGNLIISDAKLDAAVEESVSTAPGVLVESFYGREESEGKILLEKAVVTGGGNVVPYMAVFYEEATGGTREMERGSSISGEKSVMWTGEDAYAGASAHVVIDNGR